MQFTMYNKFLIFVAVALGVSSSVAQDFADPVDLRMFLGDSKLIDTINRLGDVSDFDLVIVSYGEFVDHSLVLGFKGIRTGVRPPDAHPSNHAIEVYSPEYCMLGPGGKRSKFIRKCDREHNYALGKLAWELASKAKFDSRRQVARQIYVRERNYLYFVNGRLFDSAADSSLIGGNIIHPDKGSKAFEFVSMVERMIKDIDSAVAKSNWKAAEMANPPVFEHSLPDKMNPRDNQ